MSNWKLVGQVCVIVAKFSNTKDEAVYFGIAEKATSKKLRKQVKKLNYLVSSQELFKTDLNLSLKFTRKLVDGDMKLSIFVKSSNLPEEKWYEARGISNVSECLYNILLDSKVDNGEVIGKEFEPAFSIDGDDIMFLAKNTPEYNKAFEELIRCVNFEVNKKTKSFIPGHRYDGKDHSFIYLESVLSRKRGTPGDYTFNTGSESSFEKVYLVLMDSDLDSAEKSISDVLRRRTIDIDKNSIRVINKFPTVVDSGEVLINDFSNNFMDYWEDIFDNTLPTVTIKTEKTGISLINNPFKLVDIFSYQSQGYTDYSKISNEFKQKIINTLKKSTFDFLFSVYNTDSYYGRSIFNEDNFNTHPQEVANLTIKLCYLKEKNNNSSYIKYVKSILPEITQEPLEKFMVEFIKEFIDKEREFKSDFDLFYKHRELLKNQCNLVVNFRNNSLPYYSYTKKQTFADILGETALCDLIKNIINKAITNNDLIDCIKEVNVGSKTHPLDYITGKITLNDVVSYCKGNLTDEIKKSILEKNFTHLLFSFDKGDKLV